jgi:hypothetical protein
MNGWLAVTVNVQLAAVDTEMLCVLAANPTLSVVCGTVTAQFVLGPVGLLLVHDHIRHGRTTAATHLLMDRD